MTELRGLYSNIARSHETLQLENSSVKQELESTRIKCKALKQELEDIRKQSSHHNTTPSNFNLDPWEWRSTN